MDGPESAVLLEVGRVGRVPVLGEDDQRAGRGGLVDGAVGVGDDGVGAADGERPVGMREVVLHVNHDQRGASVERGHRMESEQRLEATTGFEPVMRVLQTPALPLGHVAGLLM